MPTVGSFLLIGAVAAIVTFVTTPLVGLLARRRGWVYLPNDRTVHQSPLPDVGGLAMFVGFLAAMLTAWLVDAFDVLFENNSEPLGVVIAATIVFGVGFLDDVREVSAPAKVAGTVLAGIVLVQFGVVMFSFRLPFFDGPIVLADLAPLVTVLWLVGMTQAINLIDGLDGLAAGIVAIAAFAFFLYSQELTDQGGLDIFNIGPLLAIIAVGVCVGFLPHNFNPARIMMGDGGALFLGLLLAVSTSVVGGRADVFTPEGFVGQTYFFLAPLIIPLLILGVPIFDMAFAIVRRVSSRKSFAAADKGHLHHRLMDLGHGHRRSVVILWVWTALLSAFVLYPTLTGRNPTYLPFGIIALAIVLYTVLHPSVRARRRSNGDAAESDPTGRPADDLAVEPSTGPIDEPFEERVLDDSVRSGVVLADDDD